MSDAIDVSKPERGSGGYEPPELIEYPPLFVWPPKPIKLLKWLFGYPGYLLPWYALYISTASLSWLLLTPFLAGMKTFSVNWVAPIFLRNAALVILYATVWHTRLYVRRNQGSEFKYNSRWPRTNNRSFVFHNQLWDNISWNIVSAVPIWTAYEAVTFWMQANGFTPVISWRTHPAYCVAVLLLIPLYHDVHFYLIHRLIHWGPLYRAVHSLHHKNVNPGPWSGLAMHPIEHLLYFSGVILYWFIPAHPLHVIFNLQYVGLGAIQGHLGFHKIVLRKRPALNTGNYMHYLHHKYFEVNYGGEIIPIDKWAGTFHDGSERAQKAMKQRLYSRRRASHETL